MLAECMESGSRGRGAGVVCKVVAIALHVMALLVVYVITVQSYYISRNRLSKPVTFFLTVTLLDLDHSWGDMMH